MMDSIKLLFFKVSKGYYNHIGGVYIITNKINGRKYIGKSKDIKNRLLVHFTSLRLNKHPVKKMQIDFNLHGDESFSVEVVYSAQLGKNRHACNTFLDAIELKLIREIKPSYNTHLLFRCKCDKWEEIRQAEIGKIK